MQMMNRKPARSIDGIVAAKPAAPQPAAKPKAAYTPPAGPLHLQYLPKPPTPPSARKAAQTGPQRPQLATAPAAPATTSAPRPQPKPHGISVDGLMPVKRKPAPVPKLKQAPPVRELIRRPAPTAQDMPLRKSPAAPLAPKVAAIPVSQRQPAKPVVKPAAGPSAQTAARPTVKQAVKTSFTWDKPDTDKPVSTPVLLGGVAVGSLSLFSLQIGELALAVYFVLALWKHWPSRQTFMLALVMFGGIILTSLLEPFRYIAENLAVYAFLLLCIGTVQLAIEVRREMRATSKET